ncbi:protein kinase [candidate division KSB1 bacterium]|nr:protein kinase [candidate division KSB1 bacterium]
MLPYKHINILLLLLIPCVLFGQDLQENSQELFNQAQQTANLSEKINILKQILEQNPDFIPAHLELGQYYFLNRAFDNARYHFLNVIGTAPQNGMAYAYLGQIYFQEEKFQQATVFFQQALKWQPDNELAITGIKQLQEVQAVETLLTQLRNAIQNDDLVLALNLYSQIEQKNFSTPKLKEYRQSLAQAFYEKGLFELRQKNDKVATEYFEKIQRIFPDYLDVAQKLQSINKNETTPIKSTTENEMNTRIPPGIVTEQPVTIEKIPAPVDSLLARKNIGEPDTILAQSNSIAVDTVTHTAINTWGALKSTFAQAFQVKRYNYITVISALFILALVIFAIVKNSNKKRIKKNIENHDSTLLMESGSAKIHEDISGISKTEEKPTQSGKFKVYHPDFLPSKRFQLKSLQGRLGNVQQFLADDMRLNRQVLIDRISLDGEDQGQVESQKTLIEGVQLAARLNHANILKVEDVFVQNGTIFIVLEYVPHIILPMELKSRKIFKVQEACQIIQQLCFALDYAHRNQVIHFDIRPFHIKILSNQEIKLGGFELARLNHFSYLPTSGVPNISPAYMSPEKIRNAEIDKRTDIFSLGVVFYELVTGKQPFWGEFVSSVIFNILEGNPVPPGELNRDIPEEIEHIIMKMLAKDRADRYVDMLDLGMELKKYV